MKRIRMFLNNTADASMLMVQANGDGNVAPAAGGDNTAGGPSFEEILQFDPFDGGAGNANPEPPEPSADGGDQTPPASSGDENAQGQQAGGQQQPASPQPAAPTPPPKPVSQADLESLLRQQTDVIATALRQPQQQPQQSQQPALKFNLAVPDQLLVALRSEDPAEFKAGVGAMINSVANHVWTNFQQAVQSELLPMLPRMIDQYISSIKEQENVGRDFYGTYPQLQNPMFAPMIQTVGAQIAEEYARSGRSVAWGPELREAIAERIFQVLPQLRTAQTPARPPAARRSFATGNGARPTTPTDTPQQDMMQMLFGGPQH